MSSLLPILFAAAVFIGTAKLIDKYEIKLLIAAFIATVPPFILATVLMMAYAGRFNWDIITIPALVVLVIQYLISLLVFWKIKYDLSDELFGWIGWVIGGTVVVIFIAPALIHKLIGF